jgi:citrate synthase
MSTIDIPRGLKGVVIADTAIGEVRGEEGFFHYRQYSAVDIARHRSLEDAWTLLFDGALPSAGCPRIDPGPLRALPSTITNVLPHIAATNPAPMDALRTALSLYCAHLGLEPMLDLSATQRRTDALRVAAVVPTLVDAIHACQQGRPMLQPDPTIGHAADHLRMITGSTPDPIRSRALETYLLLTIDHGFNASTFTARVIASTGADLGAALVGALGALSGPLHGGAPSRALDALDEIGTATNAERWARAKLANGQKLMGFGHAVYRTRDPRSQLLREVALGLGGPLVDLAVEVEERVVSVLREAKPGHELYANVEYYAGVVMSACGIPPQMFTPTFAVSRVIGWCAHLLEQTADNTLIRPSARYVGPPPPQPLPQVMVS